MQTDNGAAADRWLPLAEAAALLGLSVDTIRRRVKRGELGAECADLLGLAADDLLLLGETSDQRLEQRARIRRHRLGPHEIGWRLLHGAGTVPLHRAVCTVPARCCTVQVHLPHVSLRALDAVSSHLAGRDPPAEGVERHAQDGRSFPEGECWCTVLGRCCMVLHSMVQSTPPSRPPASQPRHPVHRCGKPPVEPRHVVCGRHRKTTHPGDRR